MGIYSDSKLSIHSPLPHCLYISEYVEFFGICTWRYIKSSGFHQKTAKWKWPNHTFQSGFSVNSHSPLETRGQMSSRSFGHAVAQFLLTWKGVGGCQWDRGASRLASGRGSCPEFLVGLKMPCISNDSESI